MLTGKKEKIIGYVCMILVVIIWGSSFVVLKDAIEELPIFFVLGIRFFIPGLLFLLIFAKRFLKFDKVSVFVGVILGLVLACAYLLQTIGLSMTTPSKNAFLSCTYCIFVPVLAWIFFKRRPTIYNIIAAVLCFVGVGLICLTNGFYGINTGDCLTISCGIFYALQIVINEKYNKRFDMIKIFVIEMLVAGAIFWIISFCFEIPKYPKNITTTQWLYLLFLMLICTALAQFLQILGQKYTSPEKVSILMCFEAVFATIFSFAFGKERLNAQILVGFVVILSSIIIAETKLAFIVNPIKAKRERKRGEQPVTPPTDTYINNTNIPEQENTEKDIDEKT